MRIYPAVALHDGRAVGRLRADDHHPRPVLRRRGQLLRPRRQPPRRLGAHAGPGRRLLRAAVHDRQLPRAAAQQADPGHRPPRVQARPSSAADERFERLPRRSRAPARPTTSTASSARSSGTTAAWSAPRRAWRRRCPRSPRCTRSSRRTCASPATAPSINQTLEKAGRVDDFFQLGMLMCRDALERRESCGGHFRAEYQDEEGEAQARRRATSPTSPRGSGPATR